MRRGDGIGSSTARACPRGGMADTLASGASDRKVVEVRLLSGARTGKRIPMTIGMSAGT